MLPALMMRVVPTVRSCCMCVWPHTTACTLSGSNIGSSVASGVVRMKISVSFRGVAWQNSTSPMPPTCSRRVSGHWSIVLASSSVSCAAFQRMAS